MATEDYRAHADSELDLQTMEALAAEAEEGVDMGQVIRHNQYIGWVLGFAKANEIGISHIDGNRVFIQNLPGVSLVIPYPPEDWRP